VNPSSSDLMRGRTCLVTGGTSGIGKATALGLARLGATVAVVGRDAGRGAAAVDEVRTASGNPAVELLVADLAVQSSVRDLAARVLDRYSVVHVLVNNAGVSLSARSVTPDGVETTFAVNHLAPFLLTNLVLDALRSAAPSRVVTVTSTAFRQARIRFDDLQGERRFRGIRAYNQSKLANVLFTLELARRLEGSGVTANCVHPGVVRSELGHESRLFRAVTGLIGPFLATPEEGARTSVHVASAPELEAVTGRFFRNCQEAPLPAHARDPAVAAQLWQVSEQLTALPRPTD
jgi:NAD(P)-dependent dehydrogenase (short-subunit alcohol dehydrogenase family)